MGKSELYLLAKEKAREKKFHECLALEFLNPSYFVVHHLLVLTYMLQTDSYSDEAFPKAVDLLGRFLLKDESPRLSVAAFIAGKPATVINKGEKNIDKFKWHQDILAIRTDTAELYCSDIIDWAISVLNVIREQITTRC